MPGNEDWWGYLIFVFFIVVIMVFVIKIGLMFPGLFEWNFLCTDSQEENSEPDLEMEERDDAAADGSDQESVKDAPDRWDTPARLCKICSKQADLQALSVSSVLDKTN